VTFDDFRGWLLGKVAQGWPEEQLLKIARISITRHEEAAERWVRLEDYEPGRSAPLWLNEKEARKLVGALKGQRGADFRLIRQQLLEMFDG
jgi:hypothetical protein